SRRRALLSRDYPAGCRQNRRAGTSAGSRTGTRTGSPRVVVPDRRAFGCLDRTRWGQVSPVTPVTRMRRPVMVLYSKAGTFPAVGLPMDHHGRDGMGHVYENPDGFDT